MVVKESKKALIEKEKVKVKIFPLWLYERGENLTGQVFPIRVCLVGGRDGWMERGWRESHHPLFGWKEDKRERRRGGAVIHPGLSIYILPNIE